MDANNHSAAMRAALFAAVLGLLTTSCSDSPSGGEDPDTGSPVDTAVADDTGDGLDTAQDSATSADDTAVADTAPDTVESDTLVDDTTAEDTEADDTLAEDTSAEDTVLDTTTDVDLPPGEYELTVQVTSAADAVSSYLMDPDAGAWNMFSGETVYFGRRATDPHVSYHTALRFASVEVPPGAEILEATLSLSPHNSVDRSRALALNVYAERQAASAPIDPADYDANRPDQRLRTSAFVDGWVVRCADPCNDTIEYDCEQRIADCWADDTRYVVPKGLAELVGEVVALDGWAAGNPLTLLIVNRAGDTDYDLDHYNDARALYGFDAAVPERAPTLQVRYRIE